MLADDLARSTAIGTIERIERLTTIAGTRRNASLHEIERRKYASGEHRG